jgi:DNA-binding transcriptional MerR regulator
MRIKELALATGVEADTIRYDEKQGLLPEPAHHDNGYRDYESTHLERLAFIRHCRALEMPLADIRRLLTRWTRRASRTRMWTVWSRDRSIKAGHVSRVCERWRNNWCYSRPVVAVVTTMEQTAESSKNWWRPPMARPARAIPILRADRP